MTGSIWKVSADCYISRPDILLLLREAAWCMLARDGDGHRHHRFARPRLPGQRDGQDLALLRRAPLAHLLPDHGGRTRGVPGGPRRGPHDAVLRTPARHGGLAERLRP